MAQIQNLRGTRDFYPDKMAVLQKFTAVWHKIARRFGYEEYEGPILEPAMLWKLKSGNEIPEQMYAFMDKGNQEIALRPEMTPTLARMISAKQKELPKPIRWYSIPRCFRYEAPQKGRLREFFQFNLDLLGPTSMQADSEVIASAIAMMNEFGCTDEDFYIRLSNRKVSSAMLSLFGVKNVQETCRLIDKMEKMEEKEFLHALEKAVGKKAKELHDMLTSKDWKETLARLEKMGTSETFSAGKTELEQLYILLCAYGYEKYVQIDFSIMRGFDYYTSTVFEVYDKRKTLRALAGGGRYDNLVGDFGGDPCPGVGYGLGDVTLEHFLSERNLIPPYQKKVDYFVISITEEIYPKAIEIAQKLRKNANVELEVMGRKLSKALSNADSLGAEHAVIVGPKDLEQGMVTIKELKTASEKKVKISDL